MFNMILQVFLCHRYRHMPCQNHLTIFRPTSTPTTPRLDDGVPHRLGVLDRCQVGSAVHQDAAAQHAIHDVSPVTAASSENMFSFGCWKINDVRETNLACGIDMIGYMVYISPFRIISVGYIRLYNECLMANRDACGVWVQTMVSFGCTKQGELCNKKSRNHFKYLAGDGCKWPRNHKCKVAKHEDSEVSYE